MTRTRRQLATRVEFDAVCQDSLLRSADAPQVMVAVVTMAPGQEPRLELHTWRFGTPAYPAAMAVIGKELQERRKDAEPVQRAAIDQVETKLQSEFGAQILDAGRGGPEGVAREAAKREADRAERAAAKAAAGKPEPAEEEEDPVAEPEGA